MRLYDPNRKEASFTSYLRRAITNNIKDIQQRIHNPTHQRALIGACDGSVESAHYWIEDEDRPVGKIAPKDRPLAHWLLERDLDTKITWRHVLAQFPELKNEDGAGRALRRVKKTIEKAGFMRPWRKYKLSSEAILDALLTTQTKHISPLFLISK